MEGFLGWLLILGIAGGIVALAVHGNIMPALLAGVVILICFIFKCYDWATNEKYDKKITGKIGTLVFNTIAFALILVSYLILRGCSHSVWHPSW